MRNWVRTIAWVAGSALSAKVWVAVLAEYRNYFPANFESDFLIGREEVFDRVYQAAFYSHILVGPFAIIIGGALLHTGLHHRYPSLHRRMGRLQAGLVVLILVPSGLVMAWDAHTGAVAGWGFALQAVSTGACLIVAIGHAMKQRFDLHQRWAIRCLLLLISPFLLRLMIGVSIVGDFQTDGFYQFTAWASWIMPLAIYEAGRRWGGGDMLLPQPFSKTGSLSTNEVRS